MIVPLRRLFASLAIVASTGLFVAPASQAQAALPRPRPTSVRPSLRLDALIDRDPGAQVAVGLAIPAAYNVRLAADVGAGGVNRAAGWASGGRLDILARVLSDPFRQSRWGLNAGGGVGVRVEERRAARVVAIVTLGIEGPSDGAWVPGVEVGLGGGVRAGFTLRRAPAQRR